MREILNGEGGWIAQLILWPLALVGAVTVGLVVLGVMTYEGRNPVRPAKMAGGSDAVLVAGSAERSLTDAEQATFERSCKICHENRGSGAPLTGDVEAWQRIVDQGMPAVLQHTVSGYRGMPPMGLCMDCNEAELIAFIEHMGQFESGMEPGS